MSRQQINFGFYFFKRLDPAKFRRALCAFSILSAFYGFSQNVCGQKLAFLAPEKSAQSESVRENLEKFLSKDFQVLDDSLAESVPQSSPAQNIFNLSTEDAQNYGRAVGCNFFVLIKADTLRRATLSKPDFYIESYAAIYLVSAQTGRLALWKLLSFKSSNAAEAEKKLASALENLAAEISETVKSGDKTIDDDEENLHYEVLPDENSAGARNFRAPIPYRRFKPEYTASANLYNVTATVDASVDLDERGEVKRVEITRWAGYGLDESVAAVIRKMQWRAAEKDGKFLPIRVLLRYNFKKIDHGDDGK